MIPRQYRYAGVGMLLGLFVGGGLAVLLFVTTGQAVYFTVAGLGLAVGLLIGAAADRANQAPPQE